MITQTYAYYTPTSMDEALQLLQRYGKGAQILAGGQELVPAMTLGEIVPEAVVDLRVVRSAAQLTQLTEHDGQLVIGSMVTHRTLERDPRIQSRCGLLAEAASVIGGGMQVHNRGTIGGGVSRGSPTGDYLACMVALDASLRLVSTNGERTVQASDFFLAPFTTAAQPGELLVTITVPTLSEQTGYSYYKLAFSDGCYTIASAACVLELAGDGTCRALRLALGGVAKRPIRLHEIESALIQQKIDDQALRMVAERVPTLVQEPLSDVQADAAYRQHIAGVVAKRAIQQAFARSQRNGSSIHKGA